MSSNLRNLRKEENSNNFNLNNNTDLSNGSTLGANYPNIQSVQGNFNNALPKNLTLPIINKNQLQSPSINRMYNQYNNQEFEDNSLENQNLNFRGGIVNRIPSMQSTRSEVENYNRQNSSHNNLNNLQNNNYPGNNQNNLFDLNLVMQELSNFKRIIKNVLENQNDFQNKHNDNSRLLIDQDNLIRLNNIKLNEHDTKLTEILVTFNNFMNFNEKTNKIIKELTAKYEDSAKKSEFADLKMNLYNLNKNNEMKIGESINKIEDISLKYEELKREQDIFQKYTLEKLKTYQNENMENRIQQQQQIIKLEEAREIKYNQQLEQLKTIIKNLEQNFVAENSYRKSAMENTKIELVQMINHSEEKLSQMQKSNLEMEKKILGLSKDYLQTFHDLINQNNQNTEIEIKSLKNILTNNIIKADKKSEDGIIILTSQIKSLSESIDHNKITLNNLESALKERISYFEKNLKTIDSDLVDQQMIAKNLRLDMENLNDEFNKLIQSRLNIITNDLQEKIKVFNSEIIEKYNTEKLLYENLLSENRTKIEIFTNKFNNLINEINIKVERKLKEIDLEDINFDSKLNEKFNGIKEDNEEYKKKLILLINNQIEDGKKLNSTNQQQLIDNLSNKLEYKINYLKNELETKIKDDLIIREGNLHKNIIQTEEKLFKILELKITPLQNQVEGLTEKFSIN